MLIEVTLAKLKFSFRTLQWKEEFALKPDGRDERRVILATALKDVSGLKINNFAEAYKVIEALPNPILHRVFIIYKGKQDDMRRFSTVNLYKAPEPVSYGKRLAEDETGQEQKVDVAVQRMEQQFGKKELEEAADIDRKVVAGARTKQGYRGAVNRQVDEEDMNPMGAFKVKRNA